LRNLILLAGFLGAILLGGVWVLSEQTEQAVFDPMAPPDTSNIPDGAPIVNVKLPAELSENAKIGKLAFEGVCAACHGTNAAGQNGVAPPLIHNTYRPGHHGEGAFLSAAQNGVRSHHWAFGDMPPLEGLTTADVKYIVTYIRELQRENGIN